MREFLKFTLATITGFFISLLIITIIGIMIIAGIVATIMTSKDKVLNISPQSVLHLKLDKPIPERTSDNPFNAISGFDFSSINQLGLNDILKNIKKAKNDPNILGIYLNVEDVNAGFATIEEIRNALLDFKQSGKFIISYSDMYSQAAYYLATVSDKLYINPQGMLEFKGIGTEIIFFKGAMEKLGVEAQIFKGRNNKYKSAVEPFSLDKMSPENREQLRVRINSLWKYMLNNISIQRNIPVEKLNEYATNLVVANLNNALSYQFIDGLKYYDQVLNEIKSKCKLNDEQKINFVSLTKYNNVVEKINSKTFKKDKIAIIYATGTINTGKSRNDEMGAETISEAIREARQNKSIKAIVMRVNSPGGSALASESIWRELWLASKQKPVVASMGDVAASGGYYISCPAHAIVASPFTVTGSIGVFGILPNCQKLFNDKLGITIDTIMSNPYANIGTIFRPLRPAEKNAIDQIINSIYDTFLLHVAEGRNMTTQQVDSIAKGRVWDAYNALNIHLIDTIGNIDKAIQIAAQKASLTDYRIVEYPKARSPLQVIMEDFMNETKNSIIKNELGENYKYYQYIQDIMNNQGIQTRMPFTMTLR